MTEKRYPERIAALARIVEEKQCAKVEGQLVDLFSASAILRVYDGLNDANRAKFLSLDILKMARVALSLIG